MSATPRVLIVSGMSGAGRSTVAKVLEDMGYFVVDNLPPELIREVVDANEQAQPERPLAVVLDVRGGFSVDDLREAVVGLARRGVTTELLYLDADDATLVRRYEEHRRPHPVSADTLGESIAAERRLMAELRAEATFLIDTSELNVHQLRRRVEEEFRRSDRAERPMRVSFRSFGFKHGVPRDVDVVLDVRFLPNPHWQPELRPLTGLDARVRDYVMGSEDAQEFVARVEELLGFLIPRYETEGKSYLGIGIGCTGGRHRSVAIAEELAERLRRRGIDAPVRHRDAEG